MDGETQRGFGHTRKRIALELGALVAGLALIVVVAFWLASALAGWLVRFIPASADVALGEAGFEQLAPPSSRCTDPGPQAYVDQIAGPLLAEIYDERFEFEIVVIDRPEVNAFALPGGFVAVHYGLLQAADTGEEVAGVLAHELHHVTERHGLVRVLRSAGGRVILGLVLGWGDVGALAQYAGSLANLQYDRDQEREADEQGRDTLRRAGIDPAGLARFFERMQAQHGDAPIAFLSSHPGHSERIAAANEDAAGFTTTRQLPPPPADLRCR